MESNQKQYARRDIIALDEAGGYYQRHVAAMTEEGLHSKRDIAAELGWRDARIDELEKRCADLESSNHLLAIRRSEGRHSLKRMVRLARKEAVTPGLKQVAEQVADYLGRTTEPHDILRTEKDESLALEENEHLKSLLREAIGLLTAPRGGMGGGLVVPEFMRRVSEVLRASKKAEQRQRQQRERLCDELDAELEKLRSEDATE